MAESRKRVVTLEGKSVVFTANGKKGIWSVYFTSYSNSDRIRFSTKTDNFEEAKRLARTRILEDLNQKCDPKQSRVWFWTMAVRHREYLAGKNRAQTTIRNTELFAKRFFEFFGSQVYPEDITRTRLNQWREWLGVQVSEKRKKPLSPKSVAEHLNWVSSVFNYYEIPNPCSKVERPKKKHNEELESRKYYTPQEVKAMLDAAKEFGQRNESWRLFELVLRLLAFSGCRYSEIMLLTGADIREESCQVFVSKNKKAQTRGLTLTGSFSGPWQDLMALRELAKAHYGESYNDSLPLVFMSINWFRKQLRFSFCKEAGLRYLGVHAFRHAFASTALVRFRWNLDYLAKWLGHDRSVCFKLYSHLIAEEPPAFSY